MINKRSNSKKDTNLFFDGYNYSCIDKRFLDFLFNGVRIVNLNLPLVLE